MPVPPIPPPLESLGQRPFAFYPPILGLEHNEWIYRRATWSEIIVLNTKTNAEIWVPRRFVGEVSRVDEPMMIVGLLKELEFKAGQVMPHERRVIEMPRVVNGGPAPPLTDAPATASPPAAVVGIRLENNAERRVGKLISIVLVVSITACVLIVSFYRGRLSGSQVTYRAVMQSDLDLTGQDDYFAVVRKLGQPTEDHWRAGAGAMQYRVLVYPDRQLNVVLMGSEKDKALYIGALDQNWRPIHGVTLPNGGDTSSLLRQLRRF